jgi:hypothetical protein
MSRGFILPPSVSLRAGLERYGDLRNGQIELSCLLRIAASQIFFLQFAVKRSLASEEYSTPSIWPRSACLDRARRF